MSAIVLLNPADDVGTLVRPGSAGEALVHGGITLTDNVAPGHKIAAKAIPSGQAIRKFGQIIGYAAMDIAPGEHVHSHNCTIGEHDQDYQIGIDLQAAQAAIPRGPSRTFEGYRRSNGQIGTRNYIALCSTVNCSATVVRQAAHELTVSGQLDAYPHVDGVCVFAHGTGCGMAMGGEGAANLERVLWGHATHPNVGATIFVGLGCEVMQVEVMKTLYGAQTADRFHGLTIQETGGTRATIDRLKAMVISMLPEVNAVSRSTCPASALSVALQCGGSDGYSGITANPALGVAADQLVGLGGTAILAETPEIYGAEQLLLRRAASQDVADKLIERIQWWESYTAQHGASMDNNPSPGNKAGGLTTILEKSLGAASKGGSTPLADVIGYAEACTTKGFVFMDSPGYDPVSVTGQIASGAQIVVFTTGRGSAFGSKPAPTIKLATNDMLFHAMPDDMDINCGDVLSAGVNLADKGGEILDEILAVASGKVSRSEALGLGDSEFVPWQIGAVM